MVGVPDEVLGEKVLAILVLRPAAGAAGAAGVDQHSDKGKFEYIVTWTLTTLDRAGTFALNLCVFCILFCFAVAGDLLTIHKDAKQVKQALQTYLQDKLAPYKQPREYVFVDAIPRNHMGKVIPAFLCLKSKKNDYTYKMSAINLVIQVLNFLF